jgi:hypothetical protein
MKCQNYQYVRPLRGHIISETKRDVFGHPLPMGGGTHTFYGAKGSCEVDNNSYCIWYSVGPPLCCFAIE